jgi:hypothetical protein
MNENTKKSEIALLTEQLSRIATSIEELNLNIYQNDVSIKVRKKKKKAAYHPIVGEFWETYRLLCEKAKASDFPNHSKDDRYIAINLNHFINKCVEYDLPLLDTYQLKRSLSASRKHAFIDRNRVIKSALWSKSIRCWIFSRNKTGDNHGQKKTDD